MVNAKKTIESTYIGSCNIIECVYSKNNISKISKKSQNTVLENQPCRLSFQINNNKYLKPTLITAIPAEINIIFFV